MLSNSFTPSYTAPTLVLIWAFAWLMLAVLKSHLSTKRAVIDRAYSLVVLLFAGSGCAALIYELVWFQLLQLIIGSSAVSLAMLLASYMGGMCLGSVALPRIR